MPDAIPFDLTTGRLAPGEEHRARPCCCGCPWVNHDPGSCTTCRWCAGWHEPGAPAALHAALGRCVDDLETAGRENAGLKREIARLKEQLDFVIDPARATAAQHTIKAMAGERDELREEIARLTARVGELSNQVIAFNTRNVHDAQDIVDLRAQLADTLRVHAVDRQTFYAQLAEAERELAILRETK